MIPLAYNCRSYAFSLHGSWLPAESNTNTDIIDHAIGAGDDSKSMGSAHTWVQPSALGPWNRDEKDLIMIHYCFIRDYDREAISNSLDWGPWNEIGREVANEDGDPMNCTDSTQEDKWNRKYRVRYSPRRVEKAAWNVRMQATFVFDTVLYQRTGHAFL